MRQTQNWSLSCIVPVKMNVARHASRESSGSLNCIHHSYVDACRRLIHSVNSRVSGHGLVNPILRVLALLRERAGPLEVLLRVVVLPVHNLDGILVAALQRIRLRVDGHVVLAP